MNPGDTVFIPLINDHGVIIEIDEETFAQPVYRIQVEGDKPRYFFRHELKKATATRPYPFGNE
jgi:hypothetical protein